uniref:Ig-like domain-containing protein n=1 Tax=Serinus canaria TaxID=9135 RepID=A0A8C9MU51_SERCA
CAGGRTGRTLPAFFKEGLKNREATDGATATLRCELSKVGVPVEWKKGDKALKPSEKYRMRQEDTAAELLIRDLEVEDTGEYTCVCGDQKTSAVLTVHGKKAALRWYSRTPRTSLFSLSLPLALVFRFCLIFLNISQPSAKLICKLPMEERETLFSLLTQDSQK